MGLLQRFDPPAFLSDFNTIPGQLDAWNRAVSGWFDGAIAAEATKIANALGVTVDSVRVQFYNPAQLDPGPAVEQSIPWNGFPKELLRRFGREQALVEADKLWPLTSYSPRFSGPDAAITRYRPQTEYCEWHARRDPDTQAITQVTFTSEAPEYWQALAGDTLDGTDDRTWPFPGNRELLLQRYRELVSPDVMMEDIIAQKDIYASDGNILVRKGRYNIYNKWNTTHGILHLCAPPNSLTAEIQLGADATVLYLGKDKRVVEPDALICCAAYGGPDRNSDPTIGAAVNALARLGAYVALKNPVGLYMDHIDLAGWAAPDGGPVTDCVRIVRGVPGMIERLVVEVPKERGFTVSDMTIGGEPILYGGQIAECITVHLVGIAAGIGAFKNQQAIACTSRCCIDPHDARLLQRPVPLENPLPTGTVAAFQNEGAVPPAVAPAIHADRARTRRMA
jgi:hypothetical protein